jgi:phage shock protein PspC (stress-responsive transcriptional regulator)
MEKTISINLNNQNFQIEERAYEKLDNYLESIKQHCGNGADTAEVIADIENSMAEKLKSTLKPYKEVITEEDVDSLIKVMGTVEDFDREVGDGDTAKSETETSRPKHKLYRDTDNAVIGGVCSGLGAYFDADPVIFRIIFIILLFCRGGGLLIYIVLWIAMPEAKTAHQKLEMQGQAPTLAALKNISKNEKKNFQDFKEQWKQKSTVSRILNLPILIINGLLLAIKKVWRAFWPIIVICFGLMLTILSFIGLGFVGVGSLLALLYGHSAYQIRFVPITLLTNLLPYNRLVIPAS